jgi:hypothetical protein
MVEENKIAEQNQVFKKRLDFYWQFIAVYAVALVIYAVLRRMVIDGDFVVSILDPISVLFSIFIVLTLLSVLFQEIEKKEIIIGDDYFILKTRFREKKYSASDIRRISFSKDRRVRVKKQIRVIKILVKSRRFSIKIHPSAFWDDKGLVQSIMKLKQNLKTKV